MNPRDIDLRLLYTLEAIHRSGSITGAAEELNLSQPAVSHSLRRLRSVFGDRLFIRTADGVTPTPLAEQLAASARRIQYTVRSELEASMHFDPAHLTRVIHLCMTDAGELVMLPRLLRRLHEEAPGVEVQTLTMPPKVMVEALDNGVADLAIGPFPELARTTLSRQRLYQRGFLCLVARDQRAVGRRGLTLETYLSEGHLVVQSPGRTEEVFERFLAENGLSRTVTLRVPHTLCVPAVVRETDLIATVPQSVGTFFSSYPGINVFPVPFAEPMAPPVTTVSQYWSSRFEMDRTNAWLRGVVADLFHEPADVPAGAPA
ncbi:LysR family transcriptional regulator [Streptomyces malaysiensis]|uniref:LysR family transcriptional regulator n=1 Tax=Streptomyces malaysiensis TaxID=92644 RepID=UPI002B30AAC2|nr:LysR family transcriptional regulator [Streptomyces malaysiensis]